MIGLFSSNYDIMECGDRDISLSLDKLVGDFTEEACK
jgi:hypothetical protein